MLTGIIGILGALAGFVPALLQYLSLKASNAQAIELRRLEIEAAKANIALEVDLENVRADIEQQKHVYEFAAGSSGVKWVDALAVFVRPYITLIMFHVWIGLEVFLLLYGIANGVDFDKMVGALWDADVKSLFAAIIGFWFGDRGGKRWQQSMPATLAVTKPPPMTGSKVEPKVEPRGRGVDPDFIPKPAGSRD